MAGKNFVIKFKKLYEPSASITTVLQSLLVNDGKEVRLTIIFEVF